MTLQQWRDNGWIAEVDRSRVEVANLLGIAQREIADGSLEGMSADGVFDHAYGAVRTLCQVALHACGYSVPKGTDQHLRTIESLKFTLGGEWVEAADHYDRCRRMRHQSLYDRSGVVRAKDAFDLLASAKALADTVRQWLSKNHPDLV